MEWMTLAGTGLGAIVGVGSTLVADHTRWRRDAIDRSRQERKDIYIACLTTFRQAHEAMRAVATGDQREPQGAAAVDARVREAFRASGCNEARESAVICVPPELVSAIQVAYLSLRTIRDVLASGSPLDSAPYQDARREHRRATRSAQAQMRIDLGSSRRARSGRRPRSVPRTPRRAARTAVLDPEGRVFLLCYDNEEVGVHWAMPGGGLEPGESPREGALREMREETGWDDLTPAPCCAPGSTTSPGSVSPCASTSTSTWRAARIGSRTAAVPPPAPRRASSPGAGAVRRSWPPRATPSGRPNWPGCSSSWRVPDRPHSEPCRTAFGYKRVKP